MRERPLTPTGLGRRNRRLSDQETRDRMLRAAIEMINRTGLTVSLDHISFEDVIRDADVSRSTAYRHWPYKDLFFSDLVKELASSASPTIIRDEIQLMKQVLTEHLDWLETPQLRHSLMLELIRRLALLDFQTVLISPGWRTYLALHATFSSLTDGKLRDQVQAALAQAEATRTAQVAQAWQQLAGLFGYRLRPELAASYETLAALLSATMRGLVITALSTPDIATHVTVASPFGAAGKDQWSLPAIGIASIAMAFLEPDATIEWDSERLTEIHRTLDAWGQHRS
ncbi:MAG TPA: TetR/AcrR family transcriptional regulator [Jiangellales bacterium]|nr:TetR/AcrR family transcriptional regulator [Jiangellales bacterium]